MNTHLVEALAQAVLSLSPEEQKCFNQILAQAYPQEFSYENNPRVDTVEHKTQEVMSLAQIGGSFDFLHHEPALYSLEDGEPQYDLTGKR